MVHAIIVLPGTTGTDLLQNQNTNPVPPKAPSPPPQAAPPAALSTTIWSTGAFQSAEAADHAGVAPGIAAMVKPLFASLPSGYSDKTGLFDRKGKSTGYISLIESIVAAAGGSYTAMYASWPTDAPPLAAEASETWGLTLPLTGNAVIGWGYDWRQDNLATTAVMLQNFLYNLTIKGKVDKITLIGHSMGGLVSRCYLEAIAPKSTYSQDATILGMVDQLITLGTPHLGAPMALAPISKTLEIVKGLSGEVFFFLLEELLNKPSPTTLKNLTDIIDGVVNSPGPTTTTPGMGVSTYQLLPYNAFINGSAYSFNPYNLPSDLQALLNSAGFQQANLTATTAFFKALSYTSNPNTKITYNCLYGIVADKDGYRSKNLPGVFKTTTGYTYTSPSKLEAVRTDGGGDLVVPIDSAMFTGNTSVSVFAIPGADHIYMPSNPDIQTQVNKLLSFAS